MTDEELKKAAEDFIAFNGNQDPRGLRGPSGIDSDKDWYLLDQEIIDWCVQFSPSVREDIQLTAYHFVDWQKKQMMKEAVEGEVIVPIYGGDDTWSAEIKIPGRYEIGDKVKLIIVKE